MRAIGIDIGSSSIKVVEALSTNKGVQILSFVEHPIGTNPGFDPEIEIVEFLQGLAAQYDTTQVKVVMALRQEKVSVRHKVFPFADRLKILKSLPFELEEDLPFSSDTAIYDARMISMHGTQAEVLACATPKHRIQEVLDRFQQSGLQIAHLSAEGLAFSNCFERWWEPVPQAPAASLDLNAADANADRRKLKLVIQLGHTHTLVSAFEDGQLVSSRSILWGGKMVAEAIARKYEIPYIEALREMRTKAFILPSKDGASYDQIVFSDTIAAQFREVGRELRLSVLEIETELGGKVLAAEVTGGLAGVLHLPAFLTQLLEVPVNIASFLPAYNTQFEKTQTVENSIGTALGLAIEGLRKPRNPAVQFLRGEFAPQNESLQVLWDTWGLTAKVAAASLVVFFIYSMTRDSLTASLAETASNALTDQAKSVAKLPNRQANESGVKKYIRDKRKRAVEMKALESVSKMNSALELVKKISDVTPARANMALNVTVLRVEDQNVTIEGVVGNAQQRTLLQKALAGLAKDGKVNPRPAPAAPNAALGVPFAFGFTVDRGVER